MKYNNFPSSGRMIIISCHHVAVFKQSIMYYTFLTWFDYFFVSIAGVQEDIKNKFYNMLLEGMGDGKMKKGESMTFEWKGKDTILARARGELIVEMKDKALAEGILSLYLDTEKSVSPPLLQNMGCIRE